MNLKNIIKRKWNYCALAFAVPMIGILLVMILSQYTPFGKYSMLYSDMYHQYYPFFLSYRRALLSGQSLLYTWNIGLGMDHLGLISYYLASPLNLLSVLVPEKWLLPFFSLLVPVKLGFASLFFAIFLKKIFHRNDFSITLFGSFYGLCAWALGYQWNIMWLDTFALLPLVILGMLSLLQDRKPFLYAFTLFLSIAANYYVGLFTCIFVLLVFICYQICRWQSLGKFWGDLWRMALYSGLAIGMTAFLELPALAALQNTQSSVNKFPTGFKLNIADENTWKGLFGAMAQVAAQTCSGLEPTFKEGLPNLYCGILTAMLSVMYLTSRKVNLRDKLCSVSLLLFFNLSFILRQLDYIWHGFHFTNMIPYRFSFLYSFVLLYMAYSAYLHRRSIRIYQILVAGTVSILLLLPVKKYSLIFWISNLGFLSVYLGTLLYSQYHKKNTAINEHTMVAYVKESAHRKNIAGIILSTAMIAELVVNLVNFGITFSGTNISNYPMGKHDTAEVIRYMKEKESDTPFYRTEATHSQTLNDGALNQYYGITTFTSSANVRVTEFMKALGYGAKNTYNRYCFEESSPVANLFLGLKYMIERQGKMKENPYFDDIYQRGNVHLLENNAYLPLGFVTNTQLINTTFEDYGNPFALQNDIFVDATGLNGNVWNTYWNTALKIEAQGVDLSSSSILNGHCSYDAQQDEAGTINYVYTSDREGFMCIYIDQTKRNSFAVLKNNEELYTETYSLPQMLSVCEIRPGDVVEIRFNCKKAESGSINVLAGTLDEKLFRLGWEILNQSTLNITKMTNTYVEGTLNNQRPGLLYTSIPDNGNWHVMLDGQETEVVLVGDVMLGILMPQGDHTVTFHYENKAFCLGCKISAVCAAAVVALSVLCWQKDKYNGKHQK